MVYSCDIFVLLKMFCSAQGGKTTHKSAHHYPDPGKQTTNAPGPMARKRSGKH